MLRDGNWRFKINGMTVKLNEEIGAQKERREGGKEKKKEEKRGGVGEKKKKGKEVTIKNLNFEKRGGGAASLPRVYLGRHLTTERYIVSQ